MTATATATATTTTTRRPAAPTRPSTCRCPTRSWPRASSAVAASCAEPVSSVPASPTASVLPATPALADEAVHGTTAAAAAPARGYRLAGRRPPHPHPEQQRRDVPRRRPGPARLGVRPGLDGDHRPRQRRPRQDRRGQGQPRHRRRPRAVRRRDAGLPGPGVEHPLRRARHGVRAPRPQRGRRAQGVRERLRRGRQRHDASSRRQRGQAPSRAWTSWPPASPRAGSRTRCSSPTTRPARASTRRTRSAGWRERQPDIALGMEGAPGHQAAGIPTPFGVGSGRGFYDNSPTADSFAAYPPESYVTWGGYDWMTSTVGGLWDSLLAEGRPWWITANSDSHTVYLDDSVRPPGQDTPAYFNANGRYGDPIHGHHGRQHHQRRLLAGLLQPDARRRDGLLLRRGDEGPARRAGVGRPRFAAARRSTCGCARRARATRASPWAASSRAVVVSGWSW